MSDISELSFETGMCDHSDQSEESSEVSSRFCPVCEVRDEELKELRAELFHTRNENHELLVQANSDYLQLLKAKLDVERELYYRIKREKFQLDQEYNLIAEDMFLTDSSTRTASMSNDAKK